MKFSMQALVTQLSKLCAAAALAGAQTLDAIYRSREGVTCWVRDMAHESDG